MRGCSKYDNPILHYDTFNAILRHRTDAAHCHENSRFSVIFMCIYHAGQSPVESECAIFQWLSRTISSAPPKKESGRSLTMILKDYATNSYDHNDTYNFSALSNTWTIGWQNSNFSIKSSKKRGTKDEKKGILIHDFGLSSYICTKYQGTNPHTPCKTKNENPSSSPNPFPLPHSLRNVDIM